MVRNLLSVSLATLLATRATAGPALRRDDEVKKSNLLGFDADYVQSLTDDSIIPEIRYVDADSFSSIIDGNATVAEPFIPDDKTVEEADVAKRFINGADDRFLYSSTNYPFSTVGKLYWSNGVFCSGALIGPRHVLTAKHCLVDGASGTFAPSFDNGPRLGSGQVVLAVTTSIDWGTPCGFKGDWAVLILDNRLGDQQGYMGVKLPDPGLQDRPIFDHVGYPGDRDSGNRPYRTPGNTIQSFRPWDCDSTGPYYTDTDCMGGQSGGPHWQEDNGPYIWGTLSVTFAVGSEAWSGWGSGDQMLQTVIDLRNEFP